MKNKLIKRLPLSILFWTVALSLHTIIRYYGVYEEPGVNVVFDFNFSLINYLKYGFITGLIFGVLYAPVSILIEDNVKPNLSLGIQLLIESIIFTTLFAFAWTLSLKMWDLENGTTFFSEDNFWWVKNKFYWATVIYASYISFGFSFIRIELSKSLRHLQATQEQLIKSEKLASLGELTAGISHEIQNPLNFVNNFSDVSKELLEEIEEEMEEGNMEDVKEILGLLSQNIQRINEHGTRASNIVKGMLLHSQDGLREKHLTDINSLVEEYILIVQQESTTKYKDFNVQIERAFNKNLNKVNLIPEDIGRVLLNLLTNAMYALHKRKQTETKDYTPILSVRTEKEGTKTIIEVSDNGMGISKENLDKVFQPFFTTKPTGEGTGLGLSLSYDTVKAHGGDLAVSSELGKGTSFRISLPG